MTVAARRRPREAARRELPVRRWLQLGAASAGMGAALIGWSLVGGQLGVASADTPDGSSVSAGATDLAGEHTTSSPSATADATHEAAAPKADAEDDPSTNKAADHHTARDDDSSDGDDTSDLTGKKHRVRVSATTPAKEPADDAGESPVEQPAAKATTTKKKPVTRQQVVAWQIRDGFAAGQAAVDHLPVDPAVKDALTATLAATRRTFFNQAPQVSPVQITGKLDGPVTGTLGAVDPDGDRIVYRLTGKPKTGAVQINRDGTYTYTPGTGFTGVDTFTVTAGDPGLHVNLLDPWRPAGTRAANVINQRAITFEFTYGAGAQYWSPEARDALRTAADAMVPYFTVTAPVALTFDVTGRLDPADDSLASAGSELISDDDGFHPTVIQHKIITGVDANGSAVDGEIRWNFANPWAYGDVVGGDEYDFTATAMHELMHAFGFAATLEEAGSNAETDWSTFDGFITTASGARVIDPEEYTFDTAYDPALTGRIGDGLFFGGPQAVAAYGGLVPLYTSRFGWREGSSAGHLDDRVFTGSAAKLMNALTDVGPGVRVLSPVELGILHDLGYTVSPAPVAPAPTSTAALALVGVVFLRRPKRR